MNLRDTFFNAECWPFAGIAKHSDDHITEQSTGPFNQVHMTIGEWIETAWIKRPHLNLAMVGSYAAAR